jgi:hypothetical protein
MRPRLEMLLRLVNLYAVVEEMHAAELQRMSAAVREAQQAVVVEREVVRAARMGGRGALIAGDNLGRIMSETLQEIAERRHENLERLRLEREELNKAAREQYVASRLKREQMKRVMEDIAARVEMEEQHRMQSASDDRFLARRRWSDEQEKVRADRQMKSR